MCKPEAEALTLSGKLELKDDPAEVLKILSATAPINLQISGSGNFRIDYNPTTNNPNGPAYVTARIPPKKDRMSSLNDIRSD